MILHIKKIGVSRADVDSTHPLEDGSRPPDVGNGRVEDNFTLIQFEVSDIKSGRMRSMKINKAASRTIPGSQCRYKTSDTISIPIFSGPSNPRARVLRGARTSLCRSAPLTRGAPFSSPAAVRGSFANDGQSRLLISKACPRRGRTPCRQELIHV